MSFLGAACGLQFPDQGVPDPRPWQWEFGVLAARSPLHCPPDLWPSPQPPSASVSCPVKTGMTPSLGSEIAGTSWRDWECARQLQAQRGSIQFSSFFFYPKVEKITKIEQTISAGRELQVRGRTEKQRHHSARTCIRWGRARFDLPPLSFHP